MPYPKAWLKSIELFIYNIPAMWITFYFVSYYTTVGFAVFVGNESHIPYYLIGGIIGYLLLITLVFSYIFDFFWGKHDEPKVWKYLPPKSSLREGLFMSLNSIFGYVIAVILIFPIVLVTNDRVYSQEYRDQLTSLFIIFWTIAVAFGYHLRLVAQNKIVTK